MKKCLVFVFLIVVFQTFSIAQNVGINTKLPLALLHVDGGGVLFKGPDDLPDNYPPLLANGKGVRTFWFAERAAFRTGGLGVLGDDVNDKNWDTDSIGAFSFGAGYGTKAKGPFSVAIGNGVFAYGNTASAFGNRTIAKGAFSFTAGSLCRADGTGSTAFGGGSKALGNYSFAAGDNSLSSGLGATAMGNATASGTYSTAFGNQSKASGNSTFSTGDHTIASGDFSTAMGEYSIASGDYSTAIGKTAKASGYGAFAVGNNTTASGGSSTAMGVNANTNNYVNSFCIAGAPNNLSAQNTSDNQMMMRFNNYTFWVSSSNYAYLIPASNGWAYTSDKNKKERFLELNGESVLSKISSIPFYSWNFKANDTRQYRHYGIMAQDFYQAFGKDDFGVIGNDSTVSPLDLLGVAYSAIKALEKRTEILQNKNQQLEASLNSLKEMVIEMDKLEISIDAIKQQRK